MKRKIFKGAIVEWLLTRNKLLTSKILTRHSVHRSEVYHHSYLREKGGEVKPKKVKCPTQSQTAGAKLKHGPLNIVLVK